MKKVLLLSGFALMTMLFAMCRKAEEFPESGYDERLSGGSQTAFDATSRAFTHEFEGLSPNDFEAHEIGDAAFEQTFVTAPAPLNSGLGGAYNNVSCISCHHNDGKGVPNAGYAESGLLLRVSTPGVGPNGDALPLPGYGTQLQDKAIFGKVPECNVSINYTYQSHTFPDGSNYELRTPVYECINWYTPLSSAYLLSPRFAPPVFGLGLLEAVPEEDLFRMSDAGDLNADGISGKVNMVWDPFQGRMMPGRFGLKSNTATLLTQVAAAYNNDIGITSYVFPHETNEGQSQQDNFSDDPELSDSILNAVTFYVRTLQVPARRNVNDPQVLHGKHLFKEAKCASCHIPDLRTSVNVALPSLSNQLIHPYTDLLVHDMGAGLADDRPDFGADGREWRTAPLWGLGLLETVNYPAFYLHDGRARTITEAIMWHGGEAEYSKNYVQQLSSSDRNDLLKFLKSL